MEKRVGKQSPRVIVPRPDRVRQMGPAGFGWIDARLVRDGWLEVMPAEAVAVYLFLCLVADRRGVSWYRRDRIRQALGMSEDRVHAALRRLHDLDLVAYRPFSRHASEGFRQVLSLPESGPPAFFAQVERLRSLCQSESEANHGSDMVASAG